MLQGDVGDGIADEQLLLPLPVIPLLGIWDGVVSVLRVYAEAELRAMVEPFGKAYAWEYRECPTVLGGTLTVFMGLPPVAKDRR